ncbi:hypothetical protein [Streptomyces sulphureus]|uniref:hypothetical protein n=1 Tax=Streptomyces sulphureus TaxID=47758 RepID=UPI0003638C75|nr:hypothetical protein [Streptomyces sulphureus]
MDAELRGELEEKARSGARLSREDGVALLSSDDLAWLGGLAHAARLAAVGDVGYLAVTRRLDLAGPEPAAAARESASAGATEVVVTGVESVAGQVGWAAVPERLRAVAAELAAGTSLAACSASQLRGLARRAELLAALRSAGVTSLAGEGPSLFDAPDAPELAEIHGAAHAAGLGTEATFAYGHGESSEQLVDRLLDLRRLQDSTGGFSLLAPLRYEGPDNHPATGAAALKVFAVARLLVDNVPHLRVGWESHGLFTAQLALNHGADEVAGEPVEEAAGPDELTREELVELVRDAGFRPVERDAAFGVLREHPGPDPDRRESPQPMRV